MKPWARLEQNYINHPKFLALSANAICLWHEGKNYCDMHQTDGLIPKEALRTFRFTGTKAVLLLTRSCGLKPASQPYAPLWEAIDIGGVPHFKMHDYLDHNDCRDAVLARLAEADAAAQERRARNAEYKRKGRAAQKASPEARVSIGQSGGQSGGHISGQIGGRHADVSMTAPSITETETEVETRRERERHASLSPPADPFTDQTITKRAGAFVRTYEALYPKHRKGARYAVKPVRDYAAAVTLCQTWPDDRLEQLAVIFLTTDHKFAEEGSRTLPQFLAIASWCDGKLAEHEAKRRPA